MMSINGFAGFPLLNGIPRGEIFVDFMRSHSSGISTRSSGSAPVRQIPGGFDDNAANTITSERKTTLPDGTVRTDATRTYDDGSTRTEIRHMHPDGTFTISGERRSLPDANGFQKVRVWSMKKTPDGTKYTDFRVFRVPTGTKLDWDSASAQSSLLTTIERTHLPDGTIVPGISAPESAENQPDQAELSRDKTQKIKDPKTVIPLTL